MEKIVKGKLMKTNAGLYYVLDESGKMNECRCRGGFRHEGITPLVGDNVTVLTQEDGSARLETIENRKNALIRPPFANLDLMFFVLAAKDPDPSLLYADKLLAIAEYQNIRTIIIINKTDNDPQKAAELKQIYKTAGYPVILTDMNRGTGIEEIKSVIKTLKKGETAAFSGPSGVGKSTIMNRLFPTLSLGTGTISEKTARGRHTTRLVELYSLSELLSGESEGFLADTPGFSMIDFDRFDFFRLENLPDTFPEFRSCVGACRYRKCTHTKEEGCAVLRGVAEGTIAPSRHDSYCDLFASLKAKPAWEEEKEPPKIGRMPGESKTPLNGKTHYRKKRT